MINLLFISFRFITSENTSFFPLDVKSLPFTPMVLWGVSVVAILALVSLLIVTKRKKCCSHQHKNSYDAEGDGKKAVKLKKRKIGYDIPIRSKPVVSSVVWQQEENDIADEVKRIYHSISNSSKPILFEIENEVYPQTENDVNAVASKLVENGSKRTHRNRSKKDRFKLHLNFSQNKQSINENKGKSSYQRQVSNFLSNNQAERHTSNKSQDIVNAEKARSKVLEWVENSVRSFNKEENDEENARDFDNDSSHCDVGDQGGIESITGLQMDNIEARGIDWKVGKEDINKKIGVEVKGSNEKVLKSCLKKTGREKASLLNQEDEAGVNLAQIKSENENQETKLNGKQFDMKRLTLTDSKDFKTARDVKKFIVTRWIDHSAGQSKSCMIEGGSDTTVAEKSANELEYEDLDSILTSVSRMDEGRISKLHATDFYKDLLHKKIKRFKSSKKEIEDFSTARYEEKREGDEVTKKRCLKDKEMIDGEQLPSLMKDRKLQIFPGREKDMYDIKEERQSLLESSMEDKAVSRNNEFGKSDEDLKRSTFDGSNELFAPEHSSEENITLKYSIVRNFSDRLKPMVYVSLQHIHGLGRTFGYDNSAVARLSFANDGEEYEESDSMKCDDDIYLEEMFSVIGTSTKAIIKDFLVIEIMLEDNDEPELYVKVPLNGLVQKATLIDSVIFEHGRIEQFS